jgi:hypothetical protein
MTDNHLLVLTDVDDEGATFEGAGTRLWIGRERWVTLGRPNSARYAQDDDQSTATFHHGPIDVSPGPR